jgi:hypothetical protein
MRARRGSATAEIKKVEPIASVGEGRSFMPMTGVFRARMTGVNQMGSYKSSAADQGLRRTAQMNAETLLITAASATKRGGSRTNIW